MGGGLIPIVVYRDGDGHRHICYWQPAKSPRDGLRRGKRNHLNHMAMAMRFHNTDFPEERVADFYRRWKVVELALFGSVLRDDFRADSDKA